MSGWRIVTRRLYDMPQPQTTRAVLWSHDWKALKYAANMGLIESAGRGLWRITALGRDWVEGRVALVVSPNHRKSGRAMGVKPRPVATWLRALPRPGEVVLR